MTNSTSHHQSENRQIEGWLSQRKKRQLSTWNPIPHVPYSFWIGSVDDSLWNILPPLSRPSNQIFGEYLVCPTRAHMNLRHGHWTYIFSNANNIVMFLFLCVCVCWMLISEVFLWDANRIISAGPEYLRPFGDCYCVCLCWCVCLGDVWGGLSLWGDWLWSYRSKERSLVAAATDAIDKRETIPICLHRSDWRGPYVPWILDRRKETWS